MEYYVIDAFSDKVFGGNPAGVLVLDEWLDTSIMQSIAAENNLSETAFLVKRDGHYDLRWFTPTIEIDLCGHATLASAYVLFNEYEKEETVLKFQTMSGLMIVTREEDLIYLDFPARKVKECPTYQTLIDSLGIEPETVYKAADFLVIVDSEETLANIKPDFIRMKDLKEEAKLYNESFGIIVSAKGNEYDFVSRFFAPDMGIDEDPVTGRAHCSLIPYWSEVLDKKKMVAKQLSKRTGVIYCEDNGERVKMGGKAIRYLKGSIEI